MVCVGELPEPQPHDNDVNTHRFCLNGAGERGGVFDLQINKNDVFVFRIAFDAIDGCGFESPNDQAQLRSEAE